MTDLRIKLAARQAALVVEREAFVIQANQRIGELNGRIAEIDNLLALLNGGDDATAEGGDGASALAESVPASGAG